MSNYKEGVRIGNWQEQAALKDRIGTFDPRNRAQQTLTKSRVIEHDDQLSPKDYASTQGSTLRDPKSFPTYQTRLKGGPRQLALERQFKQQAEEDIEHSRQVAEAKERCDVFKSTSQLANEALGFKGTERGTRESKFETRNADYATEQAITFYSHSLENSDQFNFPMTTVTNLVKPWSVATANSADLTNGTSKVRETWEHPHPLPTLTQLKELKSLRERILSAVPTEPGAPGSQLRRLVKYLLSFDKSNSGYIYVEEVAADMFETYNVLFTPNEKLALLRAFDHDRCHKIPPGRMRIRDFMDFIRPTLSPRKLEIIEIIFNRIDTAQSGFVSVDNIVSNWTNTEFALDSLLASLDLYNGNVIPGWNGINVSNLMQTMELYNGPEEGPHYNLRAFTMFYKDVVAEIGEGIAEFENLMVESWRL